MRKPRKPPTVPPALLAGEVLAQDLVNTLEAASARLPALRGDWLAQAMTLVRVAVATLITDPKHSNQASLDHLAAFLSENGREVLASVEKHGLDNPPGQWG